MTKKGAPTYLELSKTSEVRADLYPDLKEQSLSTLIQDALTRIGSALSVSSSDTLPQGFPAYAHVEASGRSSQIYIASGYRLFLVDFWSKGVQLATGQSPDVHDVASAIDHWISSRPSSADLAASFGFVSPADKAVDFEQGRAVERTWETYLDWVPKEFPELTAFVRRAYETPRLRQLFPFTSLSRFCFSRCTGYPYTTDCPIVWSTSAGRYTVSVPGVGDFEGLELDEAVQSVLQHLPKNAGPAVDGTSEDLDG